MSHPQWPISDINSKSISSGLAPLHTAAQSNDISGVKFLIQNGAEIDIQSVNKLETPLHKAIEAGNEKIVEILICPIPVSSTIPLK